MTHSPAAVSRPARTSPLGAEFPAADFTHRTRRGTRQLAIALTAWMVASSLPAATVPAGLPGSATPSAAHAALAYGPLRPGDLPWRQAGLGERQAAAHLLSRFTFGARPGEVDRVVARGFERWLEDQLAATAREGELSPRLATLPTLSMTAQQIASTYPNPGLVLALARNAGVLPARERTAADDGAPPALSGEPLPDDGAPGPAASGNTARRPRRDPERRDDLLAFAAAQGYHRQGELVADLLTQKLVRAVYAENQLAEVMTDFWFNHFNVSLTDPQARVHVLAYERDAIRPHALESFAALLRASARHPAMLLYLDNARSVAPAGATTALEDRLAGRQRAGAWAGRRGGGPGGSRFGGGGFGGRRGAFRRLGADGMRGPSGAPAARSPAARAAFPADAALAARRPTGLNENYARELLELHTLGVDGGYDQHDVVEVARAFTGWTVLPPRALLGAEGERRLARAAAMGLGFVRDGSFLFRPDTHDAGVKTVLGTTLPAGRGLEDGEQVLAMVAAHPATARHLARKIAQRFVADAPPEPLVGELAVVFQRSGGDVRAMLRALARSPELWAAGAREQKVKSPFELAASALRGLDADLTSPAAVLDWVARMGQPLYSQQAPTGWPDRAEAWVNTGALLARMNFGLELASGRLPGVRFDLAALAGGGGAGSPEAALAADGALLLPERRLDTAIGRLAALVREEGLEGRLATQAPPPSAGMMDMNQARLGRWEEPFPDYRRQRSLRAPDDSTVARVVGVLLGSPEFQRR